MLYAATATPRGFLAGVKQSREFYAKLPIRNRTATEKSDTGDGSYSNPVTRATRGTSACVTESIRAFRANCEDRMDFTRYTRARRIVAIARPVTDALAYAGVQL